MKQNLSIGLATILALSVATPALSMGGERSFELEIRNGAPYSVSSTETERSISAEVSVLPDQGEGSTIIVVRGVNEDNGNMPAGVKGKRREAINEAENLMTLEEGQSFLRYFLNNSTKEQSGHLSVRAEWGCLALATYFAFFAAEGELTVSEQKFGTLLGLENYYAITAQSINEICFAYGTNLWTLLSLFVPYTGQVNKAIKNIYHYCKNPRNDSWKPALFVGSLVASLPTVYTALSSYYHFKQVNDPMINLLSTLGIISGSVFYKTYAYYDALSSTVQKKRLLTKDSIIKF